MVNPSLIQNRINKLYGYLKILRDLSKYPLARFISEPTLHGSAERYLHLSIECLLDIGNHIVSDRGLRKPDSYQDVFLILGEGKMIPKAFAKRLAPLAGFRNILVHDYLDLDLKKVHHFIRTHLSDFSKFAKHIGRFI